MENKKRLLSAQDILEKTFHVDTRGYRMSEVDIYLDAIISDYEYYEMELDKLQKALRDSQEELKSLTKAHNILKDRLDISGEVNYNNVSNTNVDILKRLSDLEKIVHNKK